VFKPSCRFLQPIKTLYFPGFISPKPIKMDNSNGLPQSKPIKMDNSNGLPQSKPIKVDNSNRWLHKKSSTGFNILSLISEG